MSTTNNSLNVNPTTPLSPADGGTGVNNSTNTLTVTANSDINQDVRTSATPTFGSLILASGSYIAGCGYIYNPAITQQMLQFAYAGSAVNNFIMFNADTGGAPQLSAAGSDTNVGMVLNTQGTGSLVVRTEGNLPISFRTATGYTNNIDFFMPTTGNPNYTFPPSGGNVAAAAASLVSGNLIAASGTVGQIVDSGIPSTNVLAWAANASTSFTAAVGNGYILTAGTATTVTLPTTFAVGTLIGIQGEGAAWTVDIGAATNVKAFGNTYTTSVASANNSDSVVFLAIVANTTWAMLTISSIGLTAS